MNINKILNELRSEKEEVERAITALESWRKAKGPTAAVDEGTGKTHGGTEEEAIQRHGGLILAGPSSVKKAELICNSTVALSKDAVLSAERWLAAPAPRATMNPTALSSRFAFTAINKSGSARLIP